MGYDISDITFFKYEKEVVLLPRTLLRLEAIEQDNMKVVYVFKDAQKNECRQILH